MRYRYEDLGDREFQQLIQALLAHSLGPGLRAMPLGKADGGRDAVHASTVYQVKFTISPEAITKPVKWLLDAVDGEAEKIRALARRGAREYYLVTNVGGTGNLDKGTIDQLDAALEARAKAWSIRITAWWRETVDAQVSAAPADLVRKFVRMLPADQILALIGRDDSEAARRRDRALRAYLLDQYEVDDQVRFGEVDLLGPSVYRLFVDVKVASRESFSVPFRLMAQFSGVDADRVDELELPPTGQWETGAARLLLHPAWRGNAVIIGGPGQGKTTLLQYVSQVYRSMLLDRHEYRNERYDPHVARTPFRVDLRAYGEWLARGNKRRKKEPDLAAPLEEYLAAHVSAHSGGQTFTIDDLSAVFAAGPVLLALDGLDEVADLRLRERVAEQIATTARRWDGPDIDIVILVTTRPGATAAPLKLGSAFPELVVQRLTKRLQVAYLKRWAEQTGLTVEATSALLKQFIGNLELPHVRELAASPMQMAILLHLLQRRSILPEQRTELYKDYVEVFFDRERPKEPMVAQHRRLVLALHRFLAWHLQTQAEQGSSSGRLELDDLQRLIAEFLSNYDETSPNLGALFTSVTSRVVCLVQRSRGFEFEVQPLREYFAACHLAEGAQPRGLGTKDARLAEMMKRPYWSNVLRFFVGLLSEAEIKSLPTTIREVRANAPFDVLPLTRAVLVQLLRDRVYQDFTAVAVRGAVEAALEGPGCVLAEDGLLDDTGKPLVLAPGVGAAQIAVYARSRLETEPDQAHRDALGRLLSRHEPAERTHSWCWGDGMRQPTMSWLRTAAHVRALSGMSTWQAAHVLSCASGAALLAAREPVLPLLLDAGSDVKSGPLAQACVADLGDGYCHDRRPGDGPTFLEQLHASSHPDGFYAKRLAALRAAHSGEAAVRRRRRRSTPHIGDPTVLLSELKAAESTEDWATEEAWAHLLNVLAGGFGDSWLLREAVLAAPDGLTVTMPAEPQLAAGATPAAIAAWLRQAHHHNDDTAWWLDREPEISDRLAVRTWILAVALFARAQVVQACIPQMDAILGRLTNHEIATVMATARRFTVHTSPRRLDLYAPLHNRLITPSALTALLLHLTAFDSTQPELLRIIANNVSDVLTVRSDVTVLALSVVADHTKPLRPALLAGTRPHLAAGMLSEARVGAVTTVTASRILKQPQQWPPDVVITAQVILSSALSTLPALADIASENNWFSD
ncbi:NACHT domain-containing protein [Micromonospora sp. NPDC048935]|uniref:NACHT domain-containing protein n=1 Tax=Micromonospora sp. NPDC048935 TaxID=3364262 RepID=UPI0037159D42